MTNVKNCTRARVAFTFLSKMLGRYVGSYQLLRFSWGKDGRTVV